MVRALTSRLLISMVDEDWAAALSASSSLALFLGQHEAEAEEGKTHCCSAMVVEAPLRGVSRTRGVSQEST